jgi:UDP-N-acetylmuramyl pentapeptide phosphotransferase/UDP-N-acetylglucosamine-1-phosphate transferase
LCTLIAASVTTTVARILVLAMAATILALDMAARIPVLATAAHILRRTMASATRARAPSGTARKVFHHLGQWRT